MATISDTLLQKASFWENAKVAAFDADKAIMNLISTYALSM